MKQDRMLNRRTFTVEAAMALLGGAVITISGCGGSSPSAPSMSGGGGATPGGGGGTSGPGDRAGQVSANHGHSAVITSAQLSAGGALSLDIRGGADHPHTVQLTAEEVTAVANGQRVSKTSSSNDAHSHVVTFN